MSTWEVPIAIRSKGEHPLIVRWFWTAWEGYGEEVNHNCGPDCECWTAVQQLRGVTEIKRSA